MSGLHYLFSIRYTNDTRLSSTAAAKKAMGIRDATIRGSPVLIRVPNKFFRLATLPEIRRKQAQLPIHGTQATQTTAAAYLRLTTVKRLQHRSPPQTRTRPILHKMPGATYPRLRRKQSILSKGQRRLVVQRRGKSKRRSVLSHPRRITVLLLLRRRR